MSNIEIWESNNQRRRYLLREIYPSGDETGGFRVLRGKRAKSVIQKANWTGDSDIFYREKVNALVEQIVLIHKSRKSSLRVEKTGDGSIITDLVNILSALGEDCVVIIY